MNQLTFSLFITIYLYAFFFASELLYIILILTTIYTVIHLYIARKYKVTALNKLSYGFFKNQSLGSAMVSLSVDVDIIENFMKKVNKN